MQKRCPKCNITKNAGEFHKSKQTKSGLQCYCKLCRNEDKRKYREANLDQIREKSREYYQANRDRINAYTKQYYRDNIDRYKEWHAEYRGKEETKKYKREWMKKKREIDSGFKLHQNFGNLIRISLNNRGGAKNGMSAFDTVSYAIDELRAHLESQFDDKMNWDNYGSYWHVDHIMPRAHFEFESVKDEGFQRCWALENLQPLEAKANLRKGDRILINE